MRIEDNESTAFVSSGRPPFGIEVEPRERLPPLPALTILAHPDLDRIGDRVLLGELACGRELLLSRNMPRFSPPGSTTGGAPLSDPFLSRRPLRFKCLKSGDLRLHADQSPTPVAIDGSPVDGSHTIPDDHLDEGVVLEMAQRIVLLLHRHPPARCEATDCFGLVGESAGLEQVRSSIAHVADLDVSVLIRGETGTGKELVARALHEHSPRHGKPFVSVNVGALPPSLAVAELFGCKKGAYTGAVRDRPGYFGRADGGTLFLDEIGEAPAELQVMLLRALEAGEILPVGTQTPRRVDVRIISATDIDLQLRVSEGAFRAPLLHRLASYTIHLPPLRRRRDDLGRLLLHFLRDERTRVGESPPPNDPSACTPWLPAALVGHLARYHWPGNVRQLRNVTRQLVIDSRGQPVLGIGLQLEDLLPAAAPAPSPPRATVLARGEEAGRQTTPQTASPSSATSRRRRRKPSEVSDQELIAALRARRWNLKATAEELGVSRTSLYSLLERSPRVRAAVDVSPEEIRCAWERCGGRIGAMVEALEVSERALRQRLKDLGLR